MNAMGFCKLCRISVAAHDYFHHVETYHVGSPSLEMLQMKCSDCCFHVSVGKVQEILSHSRISGHPLSQTSLEIKAFLENETERMRNLLQIADGIENSRPDAAVKREVQSKSFLPLYETDEVPENRLESQKTNQKSPPAVEVDTKIGLTLLENTKNQETNEKIQSEESQPIFPAPSTTKKRSQKKTIAPSTTKKRYPTRETATKRTYAEEVELNTARKRNKEIDEPSAQKKNVDKVSSDSKSCSQCTYVGKTWRNVIVHSFIHSSETFLLFRCKTCNFESAHSDNVKYVHVKSKSAKKNGCDGSIVNIQSKKTARAVRNAIRKAFPHVDWDRNFPSGSSIGGILL